MLSHCWCAVNHRARPPWDGRGIKHLSKTSQTPSDLQPTLSLYWLSSAWFERPASLSVYLIALTLSLIPPIKTPSLQSQTVAQINCSCECWFCVIPEQFNSELHVFRIISMIQTSALFVESTSCQWENLTAMFVTTFDSINELSSTFFAWRIACAVSSTRWHRRTAHRPVIILSAIYCTDLCLRVYFMSHRLELLHLSSPRCIALVGR